MATLLSTARWKRALVTTCATAAARTVHGEIRQRAARLLGHASTRLVPPQRAYHGLEAASARDVNCTALCRR
jgi:hypothetical protein